MNATDDIRAQYGECLARAAYDRRRATVAPRWEDHDRSMEGVRAHHRQGTEYLLDALAAAGLLPTMEGRRWAYEPDGTPLDHAERQLLTAWQPMPTPATFYGVPFAPGEREEFLTGVHRAIDNIRAEIGITDPAEGEQQ